MSAENDPQARAFQRRMPTLWRADAAGAALRFAVTIPAAAGVKARRVAVYDLLGPGSGTVQISVNGGPPRRVPRIDGYCTYWRIGTLVVGDLTAGTHEIEVKLLADRPPKETILFAKNRLDFLNNADKYAAHVWYASSLLVFGDVESLKK